MFTTINHNYRKSLNVSITSFVILDFILKCSREITIASLKALTSLRTPQLMKEIYKLEKQKYIQIIIEYEKPIKIKLLLDFQPY